MGKLNRGNLLATLKKLKKMPRPKVVIANPAVQAICGVNDAPKPNKTADLKVILERRRAMFSVNGISPVMDEADYKKLNDDYLVFVETYRVRKRKNPSDIIA